MSLYCASAHQPTDWHLAHYATRAIGLGLVIVEATAVSPEGAITPQDLGIWSDEHVPSFRRIAAAIRDQGAVPALQLSHGGRKASRTRPWDGDRALDPADGGWEIVAPSAIAFAEGYRMPVQLDIAGIRKVIDDFGTAARRAREAGFQMIELHSGHGRLLHSFLSPLANQREDDWGGCFENRCRLLVEVVARIRREWDHDLPLVVRLSCVDWEPDGWSLDDSVRLARVLAELGVDLIDCTSSGIRRPARVEPKPGYQVPFARTIRLRAPVATAAVGLIQDLWQAKEIIDDGSADLVLLGRTLMTDPLLVMRAVELGLDSGDLVPLPYQRALATARRDQPDPDFVPEL